MRTTSYNRFLMDRVGLSRDTTEIFDAHLLILRGHSGWQRAVLEAIAAGAPGLRAMGWLTNFIDSLAALLMDLTEVRMFPDGNASVARLLVQELVPNVAPGRPASRMWPPRISATTSWISPASQRGFV